MKKIITRFRSCLQTRVGPSSAGKARAGITLRKRYIPARADKFIAHKNRRFNTRK